MNNDAVTEIQEALRLLSLYDNRLLPLHVDGFFTDETVRAVTVFQTFNGLEPTGSVDRATWEELRAGVKDARSNLPLPLHVFDKTDSMLLPGEQRDIVWIVQWMLNQIAPFYENVESVTINGIYDEETVKQIQLLQQLHRLENNGHLTNDTWNMLVTLFHHRADTSKR